MTITLQNVRPIDRAPQARKHVGPYYGDALRRVLAPEVTDPSLIERVTEYYRTREWPAVAIVVVAIGAMALGFVAAL